MDFTVRLWEIDTGKELKKMTGHTQLGVAGGFLAR